MLVIKVATFVVALVMAVPRYVWIGLALAGAAAIAAKFLRDARAQKGQPDVDAERASMTARVTAKVAASRKVVEVPFENTYPLAPPGGAEGILASDLLSIVPTDEAAGPTVVDATHRGTEELADTQGTAGASQTTQGNAPDQPPAGQEAPGSDNAQVAVAVIKVETGKFEGLERHQRVVAQLNAEVARQTGAQLKNAQAAKAASRSSPFNPVGQPDHAGRSDTAPPLHYAPQQAVRSTPVVAKHQTPAEVGTRDTPSPRRLWTDDEQRRMQSALDKAWADRGQAAHAVGAVSDHETAATATAASSTDRAERVEHSGLTKHISPRRLADDDLARLERALQELRAQRLAPHAASEPASPMGGSTGSTRVAENEVPTAVTSDAPPLAAEVTSKVALLLEPEPPRAPPHPEVETNTTATRSVPDSVPIPSAVELTDLDDEFFQQFVTGDNSLVAAGSPPEASNGLQTEFLIPPQPAGPTAQSPADQDVASVVGAVSAVLEGVHFVADLQTKTPESLVVPGVRETEPPDNPQFNGTLSGTTVENDTAAAASESEPKVSKTDDAPRARRLSLNAAAIAAIQADSEKVAALLGPVFAGDTEPAPIDLPAPRPANAPPPLAVKLALDISKIASIQAEAHKSDALLGSLFVNDEDDAPEVVPDDHVADDSMTSMPGLQVDAAHQELVRRLLTQVTWHRAELQLIADELDLMLDGALEQVNDAFYEAFDEPLVEGEDLLEVSANAHALLQRAGQQMVTQ